jgi:hypothetical protein
LADTAWPVETDIYILPDGRVIIADLPAELSALADSLGAYEEYPPTPANSAAL